MDVRNGENAGNQIVINWLSAFSPFTKMFSAAFVYRISLIFSQTIPGFTTLGKRTFENLVGKGENAGN